MLRFCCVATTESATLLERDVNRRRQNRRSFCRESCSLHAGLHRGRSLAEPQRRAGSAVVPNCAIAEHGGPSLSQPTSEPNRCSNFELSKSRCEWRALWRRTPPRSLGDTIHSIRIVYKCQDLILDSGVVHCVLKQPKCCINSTLLGRLLSYFLGGFQNHLKGISGGNDAAMRISRIANKMPECSPISRPPA